MSMICAVYAVSKTDARRLGDDPDFFGELTHYENKNAISCSLEKAWHGLHFLLTGEAWETDGPAAFIVAGGQEIDGSDYGYGPARLFWADETQQIHGAISGLTDDQVWSRFDPQVMAEEDVYPGIWDEPETDLREEYLLYFHDLQKLITDAVANDRGLMVMLC